MKRLVILTLVILSIVNFNVVEIIENIYDSDITSDSKLSSEISLNHIDNFNIKENTENVPKNSGSFKSYMSYKTITSRSSKQYRLQNIAYTDDYGLRRIDIYFIVATGSYYGKVGDILRIELDTGEYFLAIKGDMKADIHTDKNNQIAHDGSVVEFIVDPSKLESLAKRMGNISYIKGFEGCVKSIEIIGEYVI